MAMTPCDGTPTSEKWCCGAESNNCCSINPIVLPKLGENRSFSTPQASSTEQLLNTPSANMPSSTTSTPTTSAQTETSNKSSSLGAGAIAGAVIGAFVAVVAVFTAGYMVARKKRAAPSGQTTIQPNVSCSTCENTNIPMNHDVQEVEAMGSAIFEAEASQYTVRHSERRGQIEELP
jgi:hypothetical protein